MANRNGAGRRSSLKNPQVQELKNLIPQEVFRGSFSEYNISNMTRLSGNSARGSHSRKVSGLPPPNLASRAKPSGSGSATRSIGRPTTSGIPRTVATMRQSTLQKSVLGGSNSSLNSNAARRRSRSHETLHTPAFTPSMSMRSRSKSPGTMSTARRRGVHNETSDAIGRSITVVKDRKILTEMAKEVYGLLEILDCQARPTDYRDLVVPTKLPVAKFMNIIKFLASHFVPEAYFPKADKVDDDAERIIELMKILKYPGTLSKSHLKTPTVQHAWPGCFTFLAWLSCRTKALLNPPSQSSIDELANGGLEECAFGSYLNLFPLHFRNELTSEHIEIELEHFKQRVREVHAVEVTKTKEELVQEKAKVQADLDRLNNEVDPGKEIKIRLQSEQEVQSSLKEKIRDVETQCKKYSDTRHLRLQQERIELDINTKKTELERLKKQISSQPLSKQEASAMRAEITGLKNQLESIRHVNTNLNKECESRLEKLTVCQNKFKDLCKEFDIVERYNEHLRFLRLDDYIIPPNPFAPEELEEWMKNVSKTLRRCSARVNEMAKEVQKSSEQKEKENKDFLEQMAGLEKEMNAINVKIEGVKKYKQFMEREHEEKRSELQGQLDEVNSQLRDEEERLNEVQKQKEIADKSLNEWQKSLEVCQNRVKEFQERLEEEMGKYTVYVQELKKLIQDTIVGEADAQRKFYLENYNVDVFGGLVLYPNLESNNNTCNGQQSDDKDKNVKDSKAKK